ncbi:MAG: cytochrome c oxidase assembly protein [Chloroflexi bacterium]|nr:cytochrome c oxidase assembly protein [Chloroflexota bacterium]
MPDGVVQFSWTDWHVHPSILVGVAALEVLYLLAMGPWRRRLGGPDRFEARRAIAWTLGAVFLFVALGSPLDELSDHYLFSAHMVQHLLLTLAMPPLLLLGAPAWLLRYALGVPGARHWGRWLTRPLVAFLLFNVTFAVWHLPPLYDLGLRQLGFHILEHLTFMVTAVIFWWPVLGMLPQVPRLGYGGQMLYLFFQTIPGLLVGAPITLADRALYTYANAPRVFDLSPLDDQQIGGLLMWVFAGIVYLVALAAVFFTWATREERAAPPESEAGATGP